MKCDRCDNEATIHELNIKAGKPLERHLCEHCAKAEGIAIKSHAPVSELLGQIVVAAAPPTQTPQAVGACPTCGSTFASFRHSGLLGCPDCYAAFETQLAPLLERAHEGGTHHVGKSPRRAGAGGLAGGAGAPGKHALRADDGVARKLQTLTRLLDEAVDAEQYERAAALRDEIKRLEVEPR